MELIIDDEEAAVLTRVLRGLLPYLEQEAYAEQETHASENALPPADCMEDEVVVKDFLERLESSFIGFSGK
jgi:hypothetical protein